MADVSFGTCFGGSAGLLMDLGSQGRTADQTGGAGTAPEAGAGNTEDAVASPGCVAGADRRAAAGSGVGCEGSEGVVVQGEGTRV